MKQAGLRRAFAALLATLVASVAARAEAAVDRYAVIIGNNLGAADEARLRFAESDASKLYDALKDLGGFAPENMVLLRGEDAATVRSAIIATNDRVRSSIAAGRQAVLLVYYSGHADAEALHLGDADFSLTELEQLARGSAANLRLLVLDACRSGALTQSKGGKPAPAFPIHIQQRLVGEGAIFLTSSTVNEDSQESDAISGSFFTHYFVSGLLGAADHDSDGHVSLDEAYRFTYDNTLRASSRTLIGLQHPSFRFETSGHGGFVLTSPFRHAARAHVQFPPGITFLVARDGADGPVIAEVGAGDSVRRLSLRPGTYFLRGRTRNYLLEGGVALAPGAVHQVEERQLTRVEYARLVRKGGDDAAVSVEAGYLGATSVWQGAPPCHGVFAGPALALPQLTLGGRFGFCRTHAERGVLVATLDELAASLRASIERDLARFSLGVGVGLGVLVMHQRFATTGLAPARWTTAGTLGVGGRLAVPLGRRPFLLFELGVETIFSRRDAGPAADATRFGADVVGRALLGLGLQL